MDNGVKASQARRLIHCAVALILTGTAAASLRAADSETPSVFRPTVRELSPEPAAAAPRGVAARFDFTPSGEIALKIQPASGPEETVATWSRELGGSPTAVPAATAFPDGTLLVAFRRPTAAGSALVVVQRIDGKWQRPKTLFEETVKGTGRPTEAQPVIARSGARAVIAWYSEADGEPQVLATTSPNAGSMFVQAERIDLGRPAGGVDLVLLHDGTQFVSWIERAGEDSSQPGGLYLRRTTAYGSTLPPALLLPEKQFRPASHPRMAVVTDEPAAPVQLRVNYAPAGQAVASQSVLVTLPDPAVLADADRGCGCAPTAAETAGVTIRARVISTARDKSTVRLRHNAVPGLLRAGETEFAAGRQVVADIRAGLDVLAHLDEVNGTWTLLDYRVLETAPGATGN